MNDHTGAFAEEHGDHEPLNWPDKQRFQRNFTVQAVRSYLYLSFGMGIVALALPVLLVISGGYADHYSISYFYRVSDLCRNILVGSLCAIGVFLFLFHGLSRLENWILNLAGVAAISVAFNPMDSIQCPKDPRDVFSLHAASAVLFFICLAVVAVGFSKGRLRYIIFPPMRQRFKLAYNFAGAAMIVMPAIVAAIHYTGKRECEAHWIFWIECFGIWAFAYYWFVKTHEYRVLLRIRLGASRSRREG